MKQTLTKIITESQVQKDFSEGRCSLGREADTNNSIAIYCDGRITELYIQPFANPNRDYVFRLKMVKREEKGKWQ